MGNFDDAFIDRMTLSESNIRKYVQWNITSKKP